MCKQAVEKYELLEEKQLRETQVIINQPYFWQTINGIKDNNGKILCETDTILDELAFYFKSDRYDNDFKLVFEHFL